MNRKLKKILSAILAVIMIFSTLPVMADYYFTECDNYGPYKVGDTFEYGSYPQSQVTDEETLKALNSLELEWVSYGYYNNYGQSDFMKYADVSYNGEKYRAVTFSQYRPFDTYKKSSEDTSEQDDNGYYTNEVYFFKYEPLEWILLIPRRGLAMCKSVLDAQPYFNRTYSNSDIQYIDPEMTIEAGYSVSNASSRFEDLKATIHTNNKISDVDSKIKETPELFIPSYYDIASNSSLGSTMAYICSATATDYAKCQGCSAKKDTNEAYWMTTSLNSFAYGVVWVESGGYSDRRDFAGNNTSIYGVRPFAKVDLKGFYTSYAEDESQGYVECDYEIYDGKARILKFIPNDYYGGNLVIPETIDGYEVGYIAPYTFAYYYEDSIGDPFTTTLLERGIDVILPDTIVQIGDYAFDACEVSRFIYPNNSETKRFCFDGCTMDEFVCPNNSELYLIFQDCKIKKITVPGSVKNYKMPLLFDSYVDEIIISEGVEKITVDTSLSWGVAEKIYLPKTMKELTKALEYTRTVVYAGTRADWGKIDPGYEIESYLLKYGTEVIYAPSPYTVESVDIVSDSVDIVLGGSAETLKTTIKGNTEDMSVFTPIYKSSDESVATVDQNGKVTALKKGTATITCTVSDDYKTVSDTCTVNVINIVDKVDITPDVLEIYSGKSETLATTVSANTTDTNLYKVTYTSSDEDVAKVDENGKITAYGRGTATITCTVTDDNGHTVSDTCEVTVKYTFWRWLLRVFLFIIGVNSKI